jgi:hypothetical protein
MLERVSQIAEQAATHASRREFLGRLGQGALIMAAAIGGVLAMPGDAVAGRGQARCCYYRCGGRGGTYGYYMCHADGSACAPNLPSRRCALRSQSFVSNCDRCRSY